MEWLESYGFDAVALFPLPAMGAPPERAVNLIPGAYRDMTGIDVSRVSRDDLLSFQEFKGLWEAEPHKMELLTFLDIRAWNGKGDLLEWWGEGHTGLKNILILGADVEKMRMPELRHAPGISEEEYLAAHRKMFSWAAQRELPLHYHVDLSLHSSFVEECLSAAPNLRVSIPHLGFSRKKMAGMLKRYPNLMSDISSLLPFIKEAPAAYRSFIEEFPDRVMLGSDAIACDDLKLPGEYVDCVKNLGLSEELQAAVLGTNAQRFLGRV